jgi:hypothetical protein
MEEQEKPKSVDSPSTPDEVVLAPSRYIKPQGRKPHDPDVMFEEYHYYALKTREEERTVEAPKTDWREIMLRKKNPAGPGAETPYASNLTADDFANAEHRLEISDEEWSNASRMFRTASWGACEFADLKPPCKQMLMFMTRFLLDYH